MGNPSATVHIVDDDERILTALRRLLTVAGHRVREHLNAEDFLNGHAPGEPGCVIADLALPGLDGFGILEALHSSAAALPIIFLTGCGSIPSSVRAMKAGAVDFLTKPVEGSVLLAAVAKALDQDEETRQSNLQRLAVWHRLESLTPRAREVFGCVVAGRLNKQIAAELGTVEKTVKVHRGRMMEKMRVRTVADLVRLAGVVHL